MYLSPHPNTARLPPIQLSLDFLFQFLLLFSFIFFPLLISFPLLHFSAHVLAVASSSSAHCCLTSEHFDNPSASTHLSPGPGQWYFLPSSLLSESICILPLFFKLDLVALIPLLMKQPLFLHHLFTSAPYGCLL
jgi:hypothetical protein